MANGLVQLFIDVKAPVTGHRFTLRLANASNSDVVSFNKSGFLQIDGPDFTDSQFVGVPDDPNPNISPIIV